jgi:hypothetical protein
VILGWPDVARMAPPRGAVNGGSVSANHGNHIRSWQTASSIDHREVLQVLTVREEGLSACERSLKARERAFEAKEASLEAQMKR